MSYIAPHHWKSITIYIDIHLGSGLRSAVTSPITLSSNGILEFNQWKVYCCPPGIATTNNALESFNAMFKRSYTNHTRHTLPALYDIIHDRLLVDLSRDIISARKVFHMKCIPERIAYVNANTINSDSYLIECFGS